MSDLKFPTQEQYKELDELMTYILDEMWGTDDKQLIRESIIAYTNKWHETQANEDETSHDKALHKHDVIASVCIKCKVKVSAVPHPSKLCYECWKESKQTER